MSIESAIKDAQKAISEHKSIYLSNEQAVRDTLINPILDELGWNTKSLKFVMPNAPNDDGKIPDYILLKNGKKMLAVEAKNMSIDPSDIKIIKQIALYCYNPGIDFGVLTNGEKWLLFDTLQADPKERIVWKMSLVKDEIQGIIRKLSCISYENIEQTKQLSSIIREEELFEDAWKNMAQGKKGIIDILYQSIQQKIESDHPSIPLDSVNIRDLVSKKLEAVFSVTENKISDEGCFIENKIAEGDKGDENNGYKNGQPLEKENGEYENLPNHKKSNPKLKIRVTFPDQISVFNNKVADTFVEVIKKIGYEKIKSLNIYHNGVPIISDKKDDFYTQRQVLENCFIMTHSSTKDKIRQLHEINERLKLGMKIEVIMSTSDH